MQSQVREDPLYHGHLQDGGNDFELASAVRAVRHGWLPLKKRGERWDARQGPELEKSKDLFARPASLVRFTARRGAADSVRSQTFVGRYAKNG